MTELPVRGFCPDCGEVWPLTGGLIDRHNDAGRRCTGTGQTPVTDPDRLDGIREWRRHDVGTHGLCLVCVPTEPGRKPVWFPCPARGAAWVRFKGWPPVNAHVLVQLGDVWYLAIVRRHHPFSPGLPSLVEVTWPGNSGLGARDLRNVQPGALTQIPGRVADAIAASGARGDVPRIRPARRST
jgi:hypothetical protein